MNLENRGEFVRLYTEWLLTTSIDKQFEPFRKGVRCAMQHDTARLYAIGLRALLCVARQPVAKATHTQACAIVKHGTSIWVMHVHTVIPVNTCDVHVGESATLRSSMLSTARSSR